MHIDTDHLHVHVAINKVHPTGLQNIEPFFDKQRLMEACERLENIHGLQCTNHGLTERQADKTMGSVNDIEAHAGVESFIGKVTREVAPAMRKVVNWQALHAALAEHGLQIKPRGAGLVIGDTGLGLWCKASECGRDLSMKALTDRLGPFEPDRNSPTQARKRYEPRPRQPHPASTALFAEYQRQRQAAIVGRKQGFTAIKTERAREGERIATAGAALVALSLAVEPFEGRALDVRGTEEFRRDVAQLAAMHKIRVTFADPAMEMTRRAAEAVQQPKRSAVGSIMPALPRGRANTKGKGIEL
ncbi:MAG: relaxase/mobilization nuclease domain-containing protein [Pigmentiphaga sp.]|nr:relaxase/mobilization nuclease domain-containing protein [Pigmentiphaga sp.]